MSPEQINIAIAKACGHKDISMQLIAEGTGMDEWVVFSGVPNKGGCAIPNYHGDLNAMHEAEKVFDDDESLWHKYAHKLYAIIEMHRHPIHATSAQRAEAFLRTLGLWEETP